MGQGIPVAIAGTERGIFSWGAYPGILKMWIVYLSIFPIYFFPSGLPQVSDYFIVPVLMAGAANGYLRIHPDFDGINKAFIAFLLYVLVANFAVFIGNLGYYTKGLPWFVITAFYLYNYLVFRFALGLYSRLGYRFIQATLFGWLLGIFLAIFMGSVMAEDNDIRGSLSFQTSNQLGYYSLITTAVVLLLQKAIRIPKWVTVIVIIGGFYMAAVSISNAAIFSIVILFGIYFFESGVFSARNLLLMVGSFFIGVVLLFTTEFGASTIERYQYRMDTSVREQAGVSEWEYRGYDRITNHPGYLILGAGEGAYNRFDTFIENHEMHSSVGTIIFCYGIPGTILFTLLVVSLLKGLKIKVLLYSLPIFAYGITHMGLRFTVFWVALALFPILRNYSKNYWSRVGADRRARRTL